LNSPEIEGRFGIKALIPRVNACLQSAWEKYGTSLQTDVALFTLGKFKKFVFYAEGSTEK
jgi:hypothetical protein